MRLPWVSAHKRCYCWLKNVAARAEIEDANGQQVAVQGNIVAHEYGINAGHEKVPTAKKWFHGRDTYGVVVAPGQAIAIWVDQMAHDID